MSIHTGDCIEVMRGMEPDSVDAVVTDPPYGLEFMGKEWDRLGDGFRRSQNGNDVERDSVHGRSSRTSPEYRAGKIAQAWHEQWATEAFRVLKPGGYLLAFGGTRTVHRLASAIEDAGFEIRDELVWIYASGFPKSLDVSKALDKKRDDRADILRVTTFVADACLRAKKSRADIDAHMGTSDMGGWWASRLLHRCQCPTWDQWLQLKAFLALSDEMDAEVWRLNGRKGTPGEAWDQREIVGQSKGVVKVGGPEDSNQWRVGAIQQSVELDITAPSTDLARQWQGWGTALKPAHEPIVMARKPLIGTVAGNVTRFGTGALNIDGSRIPGAKGEGIWVDDQNPDNHVAPKSSGRSMGKGWKQTSVTKANDLGDGNVGRWPSNVLLSDPELFDEPNPGVVGSGATGGAHGGNGEYRQHAWMFDDPRVTGSLDGSDPYLTSQDIERSEGGYSRFFIIPKADRAEREPVLRGQLESFEGADPMAGHRGRRMAGDVKVRPDGKVSAARENLHPTVKPLDLMRHLVRLVTAPGGTVLDPFLGSGTTAIACELEGFGWIGIEKEPEYVAIAEARLNGTQRGLGLDVPATGRKRKPSTGHWPKDRTPGANGWGFTGQTGLEERWDKEPE